MPSRFKNRGMAIAVQGITSEFTGCIGNHHIQLGFAGPPAEHSSAPYKLARSLKISFSPGFEVCCLAGSLQCLFQQHTPCTYFHTCLACCTHMCPLSLVCSIRKLMLPASLSISGGQYCSRDNGLPPRSPMRTPST